MTLKEDVTEEMKKFERRQELRASKTVNLERIELELEDIEYQIKIEEYGVASTESSLKVEKKWLNQLQNVKEMLLNTKEKIEKEYKEK